MNNQTANSLATSGSFICYQTYSSTATYILWPIQPSIYVPQLALDGFNALIGAWPSHESDEKIQHLLDEVE